MHIDNKKKYTYHLYILSLRSTSQRNTKVGYILFDIVIKESNKYIIKVDISVAFIFLSLWSVNEGNTKVGLWYHPITPPPPTITTAAPMVLPPHHYPYALPPTRFHSPAFPAAISGAILLMSEEWKKNYGDFASTALPRPATYHGTGDGDDKNDNNKSSNSDESMDEKKNSKNNKNSQ